MAHQPHSAQTDLKRHELERIYRSQVFARAGKLRQLVGWLGERCVAGITEKPSEYTVGVQALGKPPDFDPSFDVSVRQLKRRMCSRLNDYYKAEGRQSRMRLICDRGFAVRFEWQPINAVTRPCVAVLPLAGDDSGLIAGSLSHALLETGRAQVVGRITVTEATLHQLVDLHGVHFVIEGEVIHHPDGSWSISLRMIEASIGHAHSGIGVSGSGPISHATLHEAAERLVTRLSELAVADQFA